MKYYIQITLDGCGPPKATVLVLGKTGLCQVTLGSPLSVSLMLWHKKKKKIFMKNFSQVC